MDDVIGDSTYIELADGLKVTVGVVDDEALLVIPGSGAHLLAPDDALRLGRALVARGQEARCRRGLPPAPEHVPSDPGAMCN